ncbi:hypothetical protein [Hydrogenophaga sp. 5NK40-0174]|uniref:hypothetical protein n=1 Tax=Hydrogenophaga sp. 5NK40-0174 TaxID=3127649 RepID=UPI003107459F
MPLKKLLNRLRPAHNEALPPNPPEHQGVASAPAPAQHYLSKKDIRHAIVEHVQWCATFNDHLSGTTDSVLPGAALPASGLPPLPDAVKSGLGQWLRDQEEAFGAARPVLQEIRAEQLRLHTLAKEALRLTRRHRFGDASKLLNTDFERSRQRIVQLLRSLEPADD